MHWLGTSVYKEKLDISLVVCDVLKQDTTIM